MVLIFALSLVPLTGVPQPSSAEDRAKVSSHQDKILGVVPQSSRGGNIQGYQGKSVDADVHVISSPTKDGYDKVTFWVNLVLPFIGTAGVFLAWRTVQATKAAADAALLSAQAFIYAERALLLFRVNKISTQDHGRSEFAISVRNYGRVPARNIEISSPTYTVMPLKEFCGEPDYGDELEDIQEWLAPGRRVACCHF